MDVEGNVSVLFDRKSANMMKIEQIEHLRSPRSKFRSISAK